MICVISCPSGCSYGCQLLCSKVGDNGDFVVFSGTALDRVLNPVQIGSVLAKITKEGALRKRSAMLAHLLVMHLPRLGRLSVQY